MSTAVTSIAQLRTILATSHALASQLVRLADTEADYHTSQAKQALEAGQLQETRNQLNKVETANREATHHAKKANEITLWQVMLEEAANSNDLSKLFRVASNLPTLHTNSPIKPS